MLGLLCKKGVIDLRRIQYRRVKDRMHAHDPFIGEPVAVIGRLDKQYRQARIHLYAPERAPGQHQIIAFGKGQMAIVAIEPPLALMDE